MQVYYIHPVNPQLRLISQAVVHLNADEPLIYPTALGYCVALPLKSAKRQRLQAITAHQDPYLLCQDISQASQWVSIDNNAHRTLKTHAGEPTTAFVLPSGKTLNKALNVSQIPVLFASSAIEQALLSAFNAPILTLPLAEAAPSYEIENLAFIEGFINIGDIAYQTATIVDCAE